MVNSAIAIAVSVVISSAAGFFVARATSTTVVACAQPGDDAATEKFWNVPPLPMTGNRQFKW